MLMARRPLSGAHLVKSMCLGANEITMARLFIIAAEGRYGPRERPIKKLENLTDEIVNFVEAVKAEAQMLASALGKYTLRGLSKEDVGALDKRLAGMFEIGYMYS